MSQFSLLDQADEDKLHASRLLTVEEKPFKRLTKRLLAPTSPIQSFYTRLPTPPAESNPDEKDSSAEDAVVQKAAADLQRFREDVILDFAAFESSIARIQFLRASNERERERYAAEKVKIEATAQAVRDNIALLRIQLDEAQRTLAIRKTYDVLADEITKNKALKPRDEQHVNIEKLKTEIEDLEREGKDLDVAWRERRDCFGRVMVEGMRLRRLVRDEKEPEMGAAGQDGEGGDDDMLDVEGSRDSTSSVGSPRPDQGGLTPMPHSRGSGGMTPRSIFRDGEGSGEHDTDEGNSGQHQTDDPDMGDEGELEESSESQDLEKVIAPSERAADQMDTS